MLSIMFGKKKPKEDPGAAFFKEVVTRFSSHLNEISKMGWKLTFIEDTRAGFSGKLYNS